jgi:hypothetical protein
MSTPTSEAPKYRQTLMMLVYIALAAWGGWGLAKMGEDRSRAKANAEASRITGTGEVKEREAAKPAPEAVVPVKAPEVPAEKPKPAEHGQDARATAEPANEITPAPEPAVVETPAPVGPPVLIVRTVPLAEVWVTDSAGTRPVGLADVAGGFTLSTLPPGEFSVEVRHVDLRPMDSPVAVTLKSGETVERLIVPQTKPGSLILLTDEGAIAYLDGKKVGGYAVMLGSVPSRRELPLKIVMTDGATREEKVNLAPRENRLLDLRSPAKAKAEPVVAAVEPAKTPASGEHGQDARATAPVVVVPVKLAVRVISAASDTGLIAFSRTDGGGAPLAVGAKGSLALPGVDESVRLSCVRTFGGVSVCKAEKLPVLVSPVSGELTK